MLEDYTSITCHSFVSDLFWWCQAKGQKLHRCSSTFGGNCESDFYNLYTSTYLKVKFSSIFCLILTLNNYIF